MTDNVVFVVDGQYTYTVLALRDGYRAIITADGDYLTFVDCETWDEVHEAAQEAIAFFVDEVKA